MSPHLDIALWVGTWLGLSVLAYAVAIVRGDVGPESQVARVLVDHAAKLAHLDRPARERVAERIADHAALVAAALTGAVLTGLAALIWATT